MTALSVAFPTPPVAAIETGLFLFAAPLVLMMAIWATITALRILIPEAPPQRDPQAYARRRGIAAPVRLREIVAEQRRVAAPVLPPHADGDADTRTTDIADALWARRN